MTGAAHLDPVVGRLEAEGRGVGNLEFVEGTVIEIDNVVAVETDEVVVEFGASVEASDSTRVAGLGDHAQSGEKLDRAINRSAGDAGKARLDRFEDLIGGRVVAEVEDHFEDDATLHRASLAALAAEPSEEFDTLCPCRLVQAAAPSSSVVALGFTR